MSITKEVEKALFNLRSKAGKAIAKKRGKKGMSELGKLGAKKRWKTKILTNGGKPHVCGVPAIHRTPRNVPQRMCGVCMMPVDSIKKS